MSAVFDAIKRYVAPGGVSPRSLMDALVRDKLMDCDEVKGAVIDALARGDIELTHDWMLRKS